MGTTCQKLDEGRQEGRIPLDFWYTRLCRWKGYLSIGTTSPLEIFYYLLTPIQMNLQTAPVLLLFQPTVGPHAIADSAPIRYDFTNGYVSV